MLSTTALTSLAEQILASHQQCLSNLQQSLLSARRVGELLCEAKGKLPHGQWLPWLAEHCPSISRQHAANYMRVYREWGDLEASPQFAALSFSGALALLAGDVEKPIEEIEVELIDPTPTPAPRQAKKPAAARAGDFVTVKPDSGLSNAGETVRVVRIENGLLRTEGNVLVMPTEVEPVATPSAPVEPVPSFTPRQQATYYRGLLSRVLAECQLPSDLRTEIEAAIA